MVLLLPCTWIIDLPSVDSFLSSFLLVTPEQQLILFARSPEEKSDWLRDLRECIGQCVTGGEKGRGRRKKGVKKATELFNEKPKKGVEYFKDNWEALEGVSWCGKYLKSRKEKGGGEGNGGNILVSPPAITTTTTNNETNDDESHFFTALALFFYENEHLNKQKLGQYLGENSPTSKKALSYFVSLFPFQVLSPPLHLFPPLPHPFHLRDFLLSSLFVYSSLPSTSRGKPNALIE